MTKASRPAAVLLLTLIGGACAQFSTRAQEPQARGGDERFVADYYYKAKWGYADEFIRLFKKNHFPVLKKQMETGRILSVTAAKPRYHATEDGAVGLSRDDSVQEYGRCIRSGERRADHQATLPRSGDLQARRAAQV